MKMMEVLPLQIVHQTKNLRLNRNVKCRRRLVGDQNLRSAGECHRNHDALTHTARKLVRILPHDRLGVRNLYVVEHLDGVRHRLFFSHVLVNHKGLGELTPDGEHRV